MKAESPTQKDRLFSMLNERGMARLSEIIRVGVTAATVSRLEREGAVVRLGRGLYQLPDAPVDSNHALAEAAKLAPRGVICLTSALAFHDLTDQIPPRVWMAIDRKDWKPRTSAIEIVRFNARTIKSGIDEHKIEGVRVRIYKPAKTIVDLFLYRRRLGLNVALEGLRSALRQRKATPAEIAKYAHKARAWSIIRPYLEALTADA